MPPFEIRLIDFDVQVAFGMTKDPTHRGAFLSGLRAWKLGSIRAVGARLLRGLVAARMVSARTMFASIITRRITGSRYVEVGPFVVMRL
jgi:hypothetical protein